MPYHCAFPQSTPSGWQKTSLTCPRFWVTLQFKLINLISIYPLITTSLCNTTTCLISSALVSSVWVHKSHRRQNLRLGRIDPGAQVASHGCISISSRGETWDKLLRGKLTVCMPHMHKHVHADWKPQIDNVSQKWDVLYFTVLQSDYSPQQEALMKKQAATLEDIKVLTNQVRSIRLVLVPFHNLCFHRSDGAKPGAVFYFCI